LIFKLNLE